MKFHDDNQNKTQEFMENKSFIDNSPVNTSTRAGRFYQMEISIGYSALYFIVLKLRFVYWITCKFLLKKNKLMFHLKCDHLDIKVHGNL